MVHVWLCSRALALMVLGLENARGMEVEGRYSTGQKCKRVVADLLPNSCSALERCRQGVDSESLSGSEANYSRHPPNAYLSG